MTETNRVFVNLNAEWALVCAEPDHARLVAGWLEAAGVTVPAAARESLHVLLGHLEQHDRAASRDGREHSDRWLGALLAVAVGEGREAQLAARVVVQAMLHGAVRMTRRLLRAERDFDDVASVVVSALYQVVRQYPLRRRRKVAANLLLETLNHASRELNADFEPEPLGWDPLLGQPVHRGRARCVEVPPTADGPEEAAWRSVLAQRAAAVGLPGVEAEELAGARGELIELLVVAVASGAVATSRAQMIAQDIRDGGREAAERRGVSAVAWRQRRSRTVRQLRVVADQWAAAA
ncbi:hypothetical protein DSC45_34545 [Streptomyces sp. YIM 130001]|uniref:hypothetical protein n=1 Tax=Streptomyces sp. YIM 130001 TaxID=2259644 RepID=UPI000E6509EF|nr:hypothetical protein [Streptomyces sp. YIM 130001]RII06949.1 hypothetical protein DSC45_34545 [Streptomyces sp. YIM 130001]